ncbi:LexA repressor [Weissella kandleri]|uniref:LexA repressor n=1 Tax=Weissella kandleri TaxID=1616 RepID=A0A0R2JME6_9LACO|nr:transcriptional repressor LexA [Weissella kandleri]KRN75133.1 LexA repressor [Weissella kandleri]
MPRNETKQLKVLRFIYEKIQQNGFPPTVREIGDGLGLSSPATVHGYLKRLEAKYYIKRDSTKPRALEITNAGREMIGIKKSATIPYLTENDAWLSFQPDNALQTNLPDSLTRYTGELFAMDMPDQSMNGIGIFQGDTLYIHQQNDADNGEIVAYLNTHQQIKIGRFFRERAQYRFQPENQQFIPEITFQLNIIGRVVGIFRTSIY